MSNNEGNDVADPMIAPPQVTEENFDDVTYTGGGGTPDVPPVAADEEKDVTEETNNENGEDAGGSPLDEGSGGDQVVEATAAADDSLVKDGDDEGGPAPAEVVAPDPAPGPEQAPLAAAATEAEVIADGTAPPDKAEEGAESHPLAEDANQPPVPPPAPQEEHEEEDLGEPIDEPAEMDVLSGRGAAVNSRPGNKKFRALCFAHKPHFEAGNHAAKRRIATEIVELMFRPTDGMEPSRFLKRRSGAAENSKGPYYAMTEEQAILKAQQVMRDYKRPDRVAARELLAQNGNARKRNRQTESTPMINVPIPEPPEEPIIENPFGVHAHDVLCGRGAFVNGHIGNERLRKLAQERKKAFDAGSYTEKRQLATEIVQIIRSLDPPGRFLKKITPQSSKRNPAHDSPKPSIADEEHKTNADAAAAADASDDKGQGPSKENVDQGSRDDGNGEFIPNIIDGMWEELSDEKSIHKACQVMRDIARPDRKHREERRQERKRRKLLGEDAAEPVIEANEGPPEGDGAPTAAVGEASTEANAPNGDNIEETKDEMETKDIEMKDVSSLAEKAAVEVVDKALDGTATEQATNTVVQEETQAIAI